MEERRRFPREGCLISGHVRSGKRIYEGTITDLCEDGCFVATPAVFDEDAAIQLRFRHPRTEQVVKARAVVARRVGPGAGRLGRGLRRVATQAKRAPHPRAIPSTSGTWSRPELLSRSGTWQAYDAGHTDQIGALTGEEIGDRRGVGTPDTDRTDGQKRRLSVHIAGSPPCMGLLVNASEAGFCAAAERCPPVGNLLSIQLTHRGRPIEVTAKAIWRSDAAGGLRSFGAKILKFSGARDREGWRALLQSLRDP